jgi:hypothetical protein
MKATPKTEIYVEKGTKRTFACAIEWPGWCRSGPNEEVAILTLLSYAPRYQAIVEQGKLEFSPPIEAGDFTIIDRIEGNYATDYGVPDLPIARDYTPLDQEEVVHFTEVLKAAWLAFDNMAHRAQGKQLRKGPRGGGRELEQIVYHVTMAERGYLRQLGYAPVVTGDEPIEQKAEMIRSAVLDGIQAAVHGQVALEGPRGGKRWPLAYFFRRIAWHVIDHTWEIEDRMI